MKIISLVNQKGGCGKTTTAVNLSYALASKNYKVLLIDLDPQAHATFSLGINPTLTIADLFENIINNRSFDLNGFLILRKDNLFVLGSSIGLSAMEEVLAHRQDKLEILLKLFSQLKMNFDYCLIDCPPNLGILTLNALLVSSQSIVPMGICEYSLKGVENLSNILGILANFRGKLPSIFYLITQLDKRYKFSEVFLKRVKENLGNQLLSTMIRTNIHLREAASFGKSIFEYKKDSRGSEDYKKLAEEIENITKNASWVQFIFKAQDINEVYIAGEFNDWRKDQGYKLKRLNLNTWFINLPLKKGKYRYKLLADGKWLKDPTNNLEEDDTFGGKNSILLVG